MRMRKKTLIALALLVGALAALPGVLSALPLEPRNRAGGGEEDGWRGVLTVWLVETWRPAAGTHQGWLNAQARAFERAHPDVLLAVESVAPQTAARALEGVAAAPDIVVWGSGVNWAAPERFAALGGDGAVLDAALATLEPALLEACAVPPDGARRAVPLSLGGYVLLLNRDAARANGLAPGEELAGIGAFSATAGTGKNARTIYGWNAPLPGYTGDFAGFGASLGLAAEGLPPEGLREEAILAWPGFALDARSLAYIGTQYEAKRLDILQAGGRAFPWDALAAGRQTDQALLFSRAPRAPLMDAEEYARRGDACDALLAYLLGPEAQADLARAGAVPVLAMEAPIYAGGALALLEEALRGGELAPVWDLPGRNNALRAALKACATPQEAFELLNHP